MLSVILSYFSMREKSLLNSSFFSVENNMTVRSYMRLQRSANTPISFLAFRMESSGVDIKPAVMKMSRESSSCVSFLGLMIMQTTFSICFTNQIMINVLAMLNAEWNVANTKETFFRFAS